MQNKMKSYNLETCVDMKGVITNNKPIISPIVCTNKNRNMLSKLGSSNQPCPTFQYFDYPFS